MNLASPADDPALARTPQPPYWSVIFASRRTAGDAGYGAMADRMAELSRGMPGFLGMDSARGDDGVGITVCYWRSEADIAAWRDHALHREAQRLGHARWYADFELRIAKVERAYGMKGG